MVVDYLLRVACICACLQLYGWLPECTDGEISAKKYSRRRFSLFVPRLVFRTNPFLEKAESPLNVHLCCLSRLHRIGNNDESFVTYDIRNSRVEFVVKSRGSGCFTSRADKQCAMLVRVTRVRVLNACIK